MNGIVKTGKAYEAERGIWVPRVVGASGEKEEDVKSGHGSQELSLHGAEEISLRYVDGNAFAGHLLHGTD